MNTQLERTGTKIGYFPNGTSGDIYEHEYCERCVHRDGIDGKSGCAVMLAHLLHNYKECNNEDSILHLLIPRDKDGWNEQCQMFHPGPSKATNPPIDEKRVLPSMKEWAKQKQLL